MRTHGGQPFQRREDSARLAVFGPIDDLSLLIQIPHPFLGERRPRVPFRVDDIARQIFHGRFVIGRYAVAAENVESRMPPC